MTDKVTIERATLEQAIDALECSLSDSRPYIVKSRESAAALRAALAAQPAPAADIERLKADNANLRTVMLAAAEEIHAHWDAHCDAEGYGPANLMRRLEDGIPAEYGYTAGAFAAQRERITSLLAELERWKRCATELAVASKGAAPPAQPADSITPEKTG